LCDLYGRGSQELNCLHQFDHVEVAAYFAGGRRIQFGLVSPVDGFFCKLGESHRNVDWTVEFMGQTGGYPPDKFELMGCGRG
jgi:hypothetical protein